MTDIDKEKCGFIAIVGRPNVGKSTLLNALLGQKLSITSPKPQTTRHQILGIATEGNAQIIYVDTPGIHQAGRQAMHRYMNRAARSACWDVEAIVWVVESLTWLESDEYILRLLNEVPSPVILAMNKVDLISHEQLLPYVKSICAKRNFHALIPVSARTGWQLDRLKKCVLDLLPEQPHHFPPEQLTDKSDRFRVAEVIREKLMYVLNAEVPYAITVEIEGWQEKESGLHIGALIWVARSGHKAIVIGQGGVRLKSIGTRARLEIQEWIGKPVHLKLWVKVRENWADDKRALMSLGYATERG